MRRRTKPRVVWLPPTNANSFGDGSQGYQAVIDNTGVTTGSVVQFELPMVIDSPFSATDVVATLSDIESVGYRLRRIVGKVWCEIIPSNSPFTAITPQTFICTAGFIVRRVDVATGKSLGLLAENGPPSTQIDPGQIDNWGDPWIWRRSWFLANTGELQIHLNDRDYRANNWSQGTGGNQDGPHVDQKTARIVGPEERLFLDVTFTTLDEDGGLGDPVQARVITDIRCLGSMRTSTGNRRNASR